MSDFRVIVGDCIEGMRTLPDQSAHTCVTSPPYFGLRDYGMAGQIGLEATPDAFVARLVDVFREVRRVLRDDGTLWLNLGDSYAGTNMNGKQGESSAVTGKNTFASVLPQKRFADLKPKDMIGIPWRVAFALQQPYYDGRIKRVEDRIWLAAMIDGEGCFYIHRRKAGQHAGDGYLRTQDTYSAAFEVSNTHKGIIDRCMEIAGVGSIICQEKDRRQPLWRWTVRAAEARALAREIYPHLVAKQQQCRIVCGMPPSGQKAEAAWEAMKILHGGSQTTVDFPAPETCFQPGYYLRQDLIWSKPNPMPESVTDRCTKAHEYLFLLSKSAKYFYDAEAISEAFADDRMGASGAKSLPYSEGAGRHDTLSDGIKPGLGARPQREKRNRRSVWTVTTKPYAGAHFATFPPDLIEPCILAGSPVRCCAACGAPHQRVTSRGADQPEVAASDLDRFGTGDAGVHRKVGGQYQKWLNENPKQTVGWNPGCACDAGVMGGTVLDPFGGSGTTAGVAVKHGRKAILCELNPEYAALVPDRVRAIAGDTPDMFMEAAE